MTTQRSQVEYVTCFRVYIFEKPRERILKPLKVVGVDPFYYGGSIRVDVTTNFSMN